MTKTATYNVGFRKRAIITDDDDSLSIQVIYGGVPVCSRTFKRKPHQDKAKLDAIGMLTGMDYESGVIAYLALCRLFKKKPRIFADPVETFCFLMDCDGNGFAVAKLPSWMNFTGWKTGVAKKNWLNSINRDRIETFGVAEGWFVVFCQPESGELMWVDRSNLSEAVGTRLGSSHKSPRMCRDTYGVLDNALLLPEEFRKKVFALVDQVAGPSVFEEWKFARRMIA